MPSVVVHLHLHQPPREDPWLGDVPRDPAAAPDHDLTARVERECYRALTAARVNDADGRVRRLVDTLARASFDVAPALLGWLARARPSTYAAVLAADRAAVRRTGHGAALAHPYHHTVLPLLSRRDQATEVRWGLAEFRRRFGREAAGMWLPECAADDVTLDVLAEAGVRFTVLAPRQLRPVEAAGELADPPVEGAVPPAPSVPAVPAVGRVATASGRGLAVYTYDAEIAHDVSFGGLLRDGRAWAARLRDAARAHPDGLGAFAAEAETFGHHHRFGDMALAALFDTLEAGAEATAGADGAWAEPVRVTNFAAHLAAREAGGDELAAVALVGPSSWSCPHGLERWRADCGCRRDPGTHQRWRAPLRAAFEQLRAALAERFAREGGPLFAGAPGGADAVRDAYNDALPAARGPGDVLATAGGAVPPTRDPVWARELLEMEREALAMFDSDAWFGDDVDEGPARLALAHAARAASLAGPAAGALERQLLEALGAALCNDRTAGSARVVYNRCARPAVPTALRVAAGVAAARAVGDPGGIPSAWAVDFAGDADPDLDADFDDVPGGAPGAAGAASGAPDRTPAWGMAALGAALGAAAPAAGAAPAVHVTVADRRLGQSATYAVTVDIPTPVAAGGAGGARTGRLSDVDPRAITVLARPVGEAGADTLAAALKLADLPSRARERVERALRRAVVRRLLDDAEREQLAAGAASLDVLAGAALVRAVAALERDRSGPAVARVLGLADLVDAAAGGAAAGGGAPLGAALADAQTTLYALAARLPAADRAALAPVAYRLGFSARGWRELDGLP